MTRLLPNKLLLCVALQNRGWVSSSQVAMICSDRHDRPMERQTIWEHLNRLARAGLVDAKVNPHVTCRNDSRNLWKLTRKGQRVLNQELARLPNRIYLRYIEIRPTITKP